MAAIKGLGSKNNIFKLLNILDVSLRPVKQCLRRNGIRIKELVEYWGFYKKQVVGYVFQPPNY